ncbi:MAG: WYL domain-containing protein [Alphaproteobacteria bacterium]|nr:WYL domain-containing protein [Alphaproteobacteria bacterium]
MSLNKAQKLVRLVEALHRRGGIKATEIMNRYDLDPRTMRRYLADMRELGIPLEDHGSGFDRVISLPASYRRAGIHLSLPEILSLHFGRKLFTFLDGTQFASDLDEAIERLEPAIPKQQAALARDLDRRFVAVAEHPKDYADQGDLIDEVMTALIYQNPARVEYAAASGPPRRTTLDVYTLATYRQGLYVFARDRTDGRVKTYAIERFTSFERLRLEKFIVPDSYRPEDLVRDAFGIIGGAAREVAAVFDAPVAPFVRERSWHASQKIEELPDGRVRLRMQVSVTRELVTWLLGFGGDVQVESPEELVTQIATAHRRALERLTARG